MLQKKICDFISPCGRRKSVFKKKQIFLEKEAFFIYWKQIYCGKYKKCLRELETKGVWRFLLFCTKENKYSTITAAYEAT